MSRKGRGSTRVSRRLVMKATTGIVAGGVFAPFLVRRPSWAAETTLNVMISNVPWGTAIAGKISDLYLDHTGGKVKVTGEQFPYESHYEKLVLELSTGSTTFDMVSADVFWIRQAIANGWVTPLDDIRSANSTLPGLRWENLSPNPSVYHKVNGKRMGIPLNMSTPVFVYRKDVLEAAGVGDAPKNWNDFKAACEKIHTKDRAALIMLLGGQDACVTEWVVRLSGLNEVAWGSDNVLDASGSPIFNTDNRGERALELMKSVMPYTPRGVLNLDYPDAVTLLTTDKAAMLITWTDILPGLEDGDLKGRFGYTTYPTAGAKNQVVGGWHLMINDASPNKEEAYKFMAWMTEGPGYEAIRKAGEPSLVLLKDIEDSAIAEKLPMVKVWSDFKVEGRQAMALAPYGVTNADEVQRILFEEIVKGVSGEKASPEAMADAAQRITAAVKG